MKTHAEKTDHIKPEHTDLDHTEEGSITPLLIGLCVILILIATVIVNITSVYIEHKRLQSLADQMSSAAAQQVTGLSNDGEKPAVQLTDSSVQACVTQTLQTSGASADFTQLTVAAPTGASNQNTAQVSLSAYARLPMLSLIMPDGVPISATSSARSELEQ